MESALKVPQTLHEAMKYFADPDIVFEFVKMLLWPDGVVTCPFCSCPRTSFISTRRTWKCKDCGKQFSVKTGTIFHSSPLSLETWSAGVWLIGNAKNGISSCEVARSLGVTQKTAWFMLHRICHAMQTGNLNKFSGTVEADETFIGGKEKNKHFDKRQNKGRGGVGKEIVMGILERGTENAPSQIRAQVIPDTTQATLHAEIRENVETGSEVFTDAHKGYRGLSPEYTAMVARTFGVCLTEC